MTGPEAASRRMVWRIVLGGLVVATNLVGQQPFAIGVSKLTADASASPVIFASGLGLYKTVDFGSTWAPVYINPAGSRQPLLTKVIVDPTDSRRLYASTDFDTGGVVKSVDGGSTWTPSGVGLPTGTGNVKNLILAGSALYAQAGAVLYKSTDGAATWKRQSTLPGSGVFALCRERPSFMYQANGLTISRSSDEGATWNAVYTVLPQFAEMLRFNSVVPLAVDWTNPDLVYFGVRGGTFVIDTPDASYYPNSLYRSTDGQHWSVVVENRNAREIFLDPRGGETLFYTDDFGEICKWDRRGPRCSKPSPSSAASPDTLAVVMPLGNPDRMLAVNTYGSYVSIDAGETWSSVIGTYRPTFAKTVETVFTSLPPSASATQSVEVKLVESSAKPVSFTASTSGEAWWSVAPQTGTTPATLTVTFRAQGLVDGTYHGTLRLSAAATANGSVTIPVDLTVSSTPPSGVPYRISNVAGKGVYGISTGTELATASYLAHPQGVALDPSGNVWIADTDNARIRKVFSTGSIVTVAGVDGQPGYSGDAGVATAVKLSRPTSVAPDALGGYYVADQGNDRLRYVDPTGTTRLLAGSDALGLANPAWYVAGVALDRQQGIYFTSELNNRLYRLDSKGTVTAVAGGGTLVTGAGSQVALHSPTGIFADPSGNVFLADTGAHRILKVTPLGVVSLIAGTGTKGFAGDGGKAVAASLSGPEGVAVDADGNVYVSDTGNNRIRMISPEGIIRTIAGIGGAGSSGDGGLAWLAELNGPAGIAVDSKGNVFFADRFNNKIRRLEPQTGPLITEAVNGAGYQAEISPGSWFVLKGSNLSATTRTWRSDEIVAGVLPKELDGVRITVGGRDAFLYYVSPTQINALVPDGLADGPATVVVLRDGVAGSPFTANVKLVSPAFFVMLAPSQVAARHHPDYRLVARPDQFPGCVSGIDCPPRPATPGEWILLYGTGFGPVDPAVPAGRVPTETSLLKNAVRVRFGQEWVDAVGALASPGLYQIAVQVPASVQTGDVSVLAETGGRQTPAVIVPVERSGK